MVSLFIDGASFIVGQFSQDLTAIALELENYVLAIDVERAKVVVIGDAQARAKDMLVAIVIQSFVAAIVGDTGQFSEFDRNTDLDPAVFVGHFSQRGRCQGELDFGRHGNQLGDTGIETDRGIVPGCLGCVPASSLL